MKGYIWFLHQISIIDKIAFGAIWETQGTFPGDEVDLIHKTNTSNVFYYYLAQIRHLLKLLIWDDFSIFYIIWRYN